MFEKNLNVISSGLMFLSDWGVHVQCIEVYFIYYDKIKCFSHIHVHKSQTPVPPLLDNSTLHKGTQ